MNPSKSVLELTRMHKSVNKQMFPHKVVRLDQIEFAGENLFKCDNIEMIAKDGFIQKINKTINVSPQQSKIVENLSGKEGLNNLKNYFSVASNVDKPKRVALFANPYDSTLEDIVVLEDDYISLDMFFEFMKIFMNQTNYEIVKWEYDSETVHKGLTFYLNPVSPTIEQISKDEEFITDGIFIRWNVNAVETGNYFTRMICVNGAMETARQRDSMIYSLSPGNVKKLLDFCKTAKNGFIAYREKVLNAIHRISSLSEMEFAFKILTSNGLQPDDANSIIPFQTLKSLLDSKCEHVPMKYIKTPYSVWDIYNRLTYFSNNNEIWNTTDPRRGNITVCSSTLLNKKPDIINYLEIG